MPELTIIAETSKRFSDFGPYVASINDHGIVAFQATLHDGGSGVFCGTGGRITTLIEPNGSFGDIRSHPDINSEGACCFYAAGNDGTGAVFLVHDDRIETVFRPHGPLGPTLNEAGRVAFRVDLGDNISRICIGGRRAATVIADTHGPFRAFHGLPVINRAGAVIFRADLKSGDECICLAERESITTVAATGDRFGSLGAFPIINDAGMVAFSATLRAGGAGIFKIDGGDITTILDTTAGFESFRGVLVNNTKTPVFYGTPSGGRFGIYVGISPQPRRLLEIGGPLIGGTIVDFALNPVSLNNAGQLAIRVKLDDARQLILRADSGRGSDNPVA